VQSTLTTPAYTAYMIVCMLLQIDSKEQANAITKSVVSLTLTDVMALWELYTIGLNKLMSRGYVASKSSSSSTKDAKKTLIDRYV
jgi:hypothetical protein